MDWSIIIKDVSVSMVYLEKNANMGFVSKRCEVGAMQIVCIQIHRNYKIQYQTIVPKESRNFAKYKHFEEKKTATLDTLLLPFFL